MKRFLWISGLVLALAGIGLTIFLTWAHFNGSIGGVCGQGSACQNVLTSQYATFLGLPTALYGFIFYGVFFLGLLIYPVTHDQGQGFVLNSLLSLSTTAFVISIILMSYSLLSIGHLCFYCGISFALVTLLFAGSIFWRIRGGREEEFRADSPTTWQGITVASLIVMFIFAGMALWFYQQSPQQSGGSTDSSTLREARILAYDDRSVGSPTAPIRVIEFFDLECPACQRFTQTVFPKIKRNYIDSGEVIWTFRYFPLPRHHKNAVEAHTALSAVPPSNFLEAKKQIMSNADQWVSKRTSNPKPFLRDVLSNYGVDNLTFSGEMRRHMMNRRNTFNRLVGVNQTPSFLINGELIKGGKPYNVWKQRFDRIINERLEAD